MNAPRARLRLRQQPCLPTAHPRPARPSDGRTAFHARRAAAHAATAVTAIAALAMLLAILGAWFNMI